MSITIKNNDGYLGKPTGIKMHKYTVVNNRVEETHSVIVHRFKMGDVEDPDIYAAQPLIEWQQSEKGQWVMKHSLETPMWHRNINFTTYGYEYCIQAWLRGADYTFYQLKWGHIT